jgi:hypothetical protein
MRLRLLAVLLALAMAAGVGAQPNAAPAAKKDKPKAAAVKKGVRPVWAELTAEQQATLAPLKNDWDTLEPERRQKWIQIAKRYPRMKPLEQERVQRRMQMWANLSPEQRRQARENYKQLAKAKRPANKDLRQAWAEYQALPPQERESLVPSPSTTPRRSKRAN